MTDETRKPGDLSGDGVVDFTLMSPRAKGNAADFAKGTID